ncbi:MAG TPA: HAMP domain-containing sensor histidine kinase [Gaiellaceae bacterium]|jgi:signal transduction histidine kinase
MGVLRRNAHKLAYVLITAALALAFAAGTLGGVRLHRSADVERQTIRTQQLETAVLEHDLPGARSAYANVAKNDAAEAATLRPAYEAFVRSPSTTRPFERAIENELARQSALIKKINPQARAALVAAGTGAFALVLLLIWLFELERRAGRIDRDNAERAEDLIRLRDEFVAVVSHELRTPLTSIIGYLELLVDEEAGDLTNDQLAYLEIVQRSTGRLVDLVGDLLLVAEAERGPLALDLAEIDIAELVAHAVDAARPAADARGVNLRLEPEASGTVAGDRTRMAQMLDNLISNAIKFTPEGGRVSVRAGQRGSDVVFEIADTGTGIADGDRDRLFDPFFRSREANARAVPGTGLGLTITKAIVSAHNGTIEVEKTAGGGTTFRVWLPVGERIGTLSR